jgi:hypothetical protein
MAAISSTLSRGRATIRRIRPGLTSNRPLHGGRISTIETITPSRAFYEIGNRLKPPKLANFVTGSLNNEYDYSSDDGFAKEFGTIVPAVPPALPNWLKLYSEPLKFPEDRYEIFSDAAPSWSLALGTTPTGGAFTSATNLASEPYGYGNEHRWHSAQFRSYNAARYQYWIAVLDAALIPHVNP